MIILIQPMLSKAELNADSCYNLIRRLVTGIRRRRPDWHFLVLWPTRDCGFRYVSDGFFDDPNVHRVAWRISVRKKVNANHFDSLLYERLFRDYPIDLIWCNLGEIAGALYDAQDGQYPVCVPVVNAHHYVLHHSLPYSVESGQTNGLLHQLVGAYCSTVNVVDSDHCKWMLFDNADRFLAKTVTDKIKASTVKICHGPLEGSKDWKPKSRPGPVPVIAYNHRLQTYKRYAETFLVLDRLYRAGVKFKMLFFTATADFISRVKKYPWVEVRFNEPHEDYLRDLAECDLNVTNSVHETFCISAVESMAYGQVLVAPDGITFREITGADGVNSGYPYLFKSLDEQYGILKRLLGSGRESGRKWGKRLRSFVLENYSVDRWVSAYLELFERVMFDGKTEFERMKPHNRKRVEKIKGILPDQLTAQKAKACFARRKMANQSTPMNRVGTILRYWGWDSVISRKTGECWFRKRVK